MQRWSFTVAVEQQSSHADQQDVFKKQSGSVTFDTPVLGIIGKSTDLSGSNSTLATQDPSVAPTYLARSNRGLKSDDSVTVAVDQSQVNAVFSFDMALCQIKTDAARLLSA